MSECLKCGVSFKRESLNASLLCAQCKLSPLPGLGKRETYHQSSEKGHYEGLQTHVQLLKKQNNLEPQLSTTDVEAWRHERRRQYLEKILLKKKPPLALQTAKQSIEPPRENQPSSSSLFRSLDAVTPDTLIQSTDVHYELESGGVRGPQGILSSTLAAQNKKDAKFSKDKKQHPRMKHRDHTILKKPLRVSLYEKFKKQDEAKGTD
jgi:hypothetical protein